MHPEIVELVEQCRCDFPFPVAALYLYFMWALVILTFLVGCLHDSVLRNIIDVTE